MIAWTVDDPERIERLTTLGVDGICTNDPRLLKDHRARPDAEAEKDVRGVAADN